MNYVSEKDFICSDDLRRRLNIAVKPKEEL